MAFQGRSALPRSGLLLLLSVLALVILGSTYLWSSNTAPSELAASVFSKKKSWSKPEKPISSETSEDDATASSSVAEPSSSSTESMASATPEAEKEPATADSEAGTDELGKHFKVRPSGVDTSAKVAGCEYPVLIHVTPDVHCTGTLAMYASIVHNVLKQPEALKDKVCVHVTYIDKDLKTIEEMYKWKARDNPYKSIVDCAALDNPEFNKVVPLRFQALAPLKKPEFMNARDAWVAALNKVHSWGFDLYPRILIVDADSIITNDLHKIYLEAPKDDTVTGAADQYSNCHDRSRLNGGMILLKPSRYFHISAAELLHDKDASCLGGSWGQSEQELINCICGYRYDGYRPLRPEFHCSIMPFYNSVWPRNYGCSGANVEPIRSIHFTPTTKPWANKDDYLASRPDTRFWKCARDSGRNKSLSQLKKCKVPTLDETRKLPELPERH